MSRRPLTRARRSLRVQLLVLGFLAVYLPVLLLFGVVLVTETETVETRDGVEVVTDASTRRSPWAGVTVAALAPAAAALAWWWAGRTVDRLERAAGTQRRLVEETSHALRTPLSVLTLNSEVALGDPHPTFDSYRAALERSQAGAARLRATIDDLLLDARARARTLDRRPADLVRLVEEAVEPARVLADARGITLSIAGPPSAVCPVDEPSVTRAVANLVDNAVRHAPDGSAVEVDVRLRVADAAIVVTDHGPGIAPDDQDRIFERFWRGGTDGDGTGLGLPIARQAAVAHGGSLTVASPGPGGDGSAFTLTLRR
jgi:signal transduction histidine kinase